MTPRTLWIPGGIGGGVWRLNCPKRLIRPKGRGELVTLEAAQELFKDTAIIRL
jgi:hypothetical protein